MFSNETITKKINPTTILLSQQADFIMHRIESITQFGDYTFLLASPTPLNQIILYADFKYAQLEPLNISTFNEHIPNDNLLQMAINNTNNKNRLFSLDLYSKTSYKCLGGKKQFNMYNNKTQEIETLSIIVSSNNLTSSLKNGDIIYSSKSSGYLERILSTEFIRDRKSQIKTMLKSEFLNCEQSDLNLNLEQIDYFNSKVIGLKFLIYAS